MHNDLSSSRTISFAIYEWKQYFSIYFNIYRYFSFFYFAMHVLNVHYYVSITNKIMNIFLKYFCTKSTKKIDIIMISKKIRKIVLQFDEKIFSTSVVLIINPTTKFLPTVLTLFSKISGYSLLPILFEVSTLYYLINYI